MERPKAWQGWAKSRAAGTGKEQRSRAGNTARWAKSTGAGLAMEPGNLTDGTWTAPEAKSMAGVGQEHRRRAGNGAR